MIDRRTLTVRMQSALLMLDLQESMWIDIGLVRQRKARGYEQLQHVFEYLVETDTDENAGIEVCK